MSPTVASTKSFTAFVVGYLMSFNNAKVNGFVCYASLVSSTPLPCFALKGLFVSVDVINYIGNF